MLPTRLRCEIHQGGGRAIVAVMDISDDESAHLAMIATREGLGSIDILVNNAGISVPAALDSDDWLPAWHRTLAVNLTGPALVLRACLDDLCRNADGRVVNIASTEGLGATRYLSPYTASKHGVIGLTRAAAVELADRGVTVNCVCPGPIRTAMTADHPRGRQGALRPPTCADAALRRTGGGGRRGPVPGAAVGHVHHRSRRDRRRRTHGAEHMTGPGEAEGGLDAGDAEVVLDTLASTRAVRRYRDEPVPVEDLNRILFAATRAPSGSNRQGFRFLVLLDGEGAARAKALIGGAARDIWAAKRAADGYDAGSGAEPTSPKARMAATMEHFVEHFEDIPVVILVGAARHRPGPEETIGASIYPACQNLLLAARTMGYGGVMMTWHRAVETDLRDVLDIPDDVFLAATITLGRPRGGHGPVRRMPVQAFVYEDRWGDHPDWAVDPPGTRHTAWRS